MTNIESQKLDHIDPVFLKDVTPYIAIQMGIHLGADIYGVRYTWLQKQTLKRERDALRQKIAEKYTGGDELDVDELLVRKGLDSSAVKIELIKRSCNT